MEWSADRLQNLGVFVILLADLLALALYPSELTAMAVVLVRGATSC